jgi:hypothetical protein
MSLSSEKAANSALKTGQMLGLTPNKSSNRVLG